MYRLLQSDLHGFCLGPVTRKRIYWASHEQVLNIIKPFNVLIFQSVPSRNQVVPSVGAYIPRVIPGEPDKECGYTGQPKDGAITPDLWGVYDVCQFLRINDCGAYCDSFSKKVINNN